MIHPCQPDIHRALMRDNAMPTITAGFNAWVRRVDTRVTTVPDPFFDIAGSSCRVDTRCDIVPTAKRENIGFGSLAKAREIPCQVNQLKMASVCHLQKAIDSLRLQQIGPTSCSTTDAVIARDSYNLLPAAPVSYNVRQSNRRDQIQCHQQVYTKVFMKIFS